MQSYPRRHSCYVSKSRLWGSTAGLQEACMVPAVNVSQESFDCLFSLSSSHNLVCILL